MRTLEHLAVADSGLMYDNGSPTFCRSLAGPSSCLAVHRVISGTESFALQKKPSRGSGRGQAAATHSSLSKPHTCYHCFSRAPAAHRIDAG